MFRSATSPTPTLAVLWLLTLGMAGCSETTSPQSQFVDALRLVPDSIYLVPGETAEFGVRVLDQWGNELPGRADRVEWSLFNADVAEMETRDVGVSVTALAPGQATLSAALGRGSGSAPIFVSPPGLEHVEIEPAPVRVTLGSSFRPRVRLLDAEGAEMDPAGFWIFWSTADTTVARVPPQFNPRTMTNVMARSEGQTRLSVVVSGRVARTDVIVILEPLPPTPPGVQVESTRALDLVWARFLGARDGYRLYRATTADGPFAEVAAPGRGAGVFASVDTTYTDTGLTPSTQYFYRLRACNEHGCSEQSDTGTGTTMNEGAGR